MSAPNFRTMDNFPLFAIEPEDELDAYETCREVEERLDDINDGLLFHKISKEEYALQYLKTLVAEKLTGKRILFHKKYEVPAICGVNGAACRARGECNRALCDRCPVAEQFFADRDGVELIYAVERG